MGKKKERPFDKLYAELEDIKDARGNLMNTNLKLFLTVGFCGGFTTFSTFMGDNFQLIKAENFFYSSVYLAASIICGYLLLFLGYSLIKLI